MNKRRNSIEIITIGDELLVGQTVDTNSAWIAQHLNDAGFELAQITSVHDSAEHIVAALAEAEKRADIILMTGGLGPTKDDITKKTLALYVGSGWRTDSTVENHLREFFTARKLPLLDINLQQAVVPDNCETLFNAHGTAPGMLFRKEHRTYISMPGVPHEMMHIMKTYVLPMLEKKRDNQFIVKHTYLTSGIGESFLSKKLEPLEDNLPPHISLAYLPNFNTVKLRFTAKGTNKETLTKSLAQFKKQLYELAGEHIIYEGDITLQELIKELLEKNNQTLATAESCTGGAIAASITQEPASKIFAGSVVSYSNHIKSNILKVPETILKNHGAVSKETVELMAKNCRTLFGTDYAVACSGIAGPDGGTPEKPVGTVWIAVANATQVTATKSNFTGSRKAIIERTTLTALDLLRKLILHG